MATVHINNLPAILVIGHVCLHVCMIVAQIDCLRVFVVDRIVRPVPWRCPHFVIRPVEVRNDEWCSAENRLDYIVASINVWRTYDLNVVSDGAWNLGNYGGHILEIVCAKHGLDHEDVVVALLSFHHTQIIHISVTVKVKV